jgi:glycerol-3-phosphate dehydrogenase (NAD(P)+)
MRMKLTVIGAGAWGSALAKVLHENGNAVTVWDIDAGLLESLRAGRSEGYLPGVSLPTDWTVESDWDKAVQGREGLVFAVPSTVFRSVASGLKGSLATLISVTKGIEYDSGSTMSQVLRECLPKNPVAALSGPSFAREVAQGIPTSVVCASDSESTAKTVQGLFHRPEFRVYRSTDPLGVELGGALKNVMAIGAGVGDGLGYGDNTKAAMVSRALAEMRRLGMACGAQAETFAGLSGLGDLMLTCFSRQSRNRDLGERLGKGETMEEISASHPKLAEGYPTARSAFQLARKLGVETPIVDEVHAMLYEGKSPRATVQDLLRRGRKAED